MLSHSTECFVVALAGETSNRPQRVRPTGRDVVPLELTYKSRERDIQRMACLAAEMRAAVDDSHRVLQHRAAAGAYARLSGYSTRMVSISTQPSGRAVQSTSNADCRRTP